LGSQEEIFLLPKKTRLYASRPQQPLLRESERETFFPTQSAAHKKKEQKKKKFRIENFQLQIQQSGNTNHRLKLQEIANKSKNLRSKKTILVLQQTQKRLQNPQAPRRSSKKPYNRWIIYPLLYTHWKSLKDTCTKKCTTDNR
jgi:hypothetical protein